MTDEEILKRAIIKAENNGYKSPFLEKEILTITRNAGKKTSIDVWTKGFITQLDFAKAFWGEIGELHNECDCRVLPGEKHKDECAFYKCLHCELSWRIHTGLSLCSHVYYPENCDICYAKTLDWKDHLQKMVLEENPIQYLAKFI